MKKAIALLFVFVAIISTAQNVKPDYDKNLAEKLGADENGMKSYIFVILKTGPQDSVIKDKETRAGLFKAHLNNIQRLADEGKLVLAGPYGKNEKNFRGLFILNVKTIEEAKELLQSDPTIKLRVFDTELFPWYGSAAISEHLKVHEKISKH